MDRVVILKCTPIVKSVYHMYAVKLGTEHVTPKYSFPHISIMHPNQFYFFIDNLIIQDPHQC